MLAPEAASLPSAGALPRCSFTKGNPSLGQIVRRHFDMHAVARNRADAKPAHLSGCVGNNPMAVVQHYAEPAIGEDFINEAFQGQKCFFCQIRRLRG